MSRGRAVRVHLRAGLQHRRAGDRGVGPRRRHGRRQGEGRPAERPRPRHVAVRAPGTTISVRVPMTLAITRILLVRAGGETFGLPLGAVVQIVRPHPTSIGIVGAERVFTLDGQTYPLRDLAETLGLPRAGRRAGAAARADRQPVAAAHRAGGRRDRQQPRRGRQDARHAPAPRAAASGARRCSATAPSC